MDMNAYTSRGLTLRNLLASLRFARTRIALSVLLVLLLAAAWASQVRPRYTSDSTLLVLLGSEYTYRPAAGEQSLANNALGLEPVLRTEVGILSSDDLHRSVIQKVGLDRLYPSYLQPQGGVRRLIRDAAAYLQNRFKLNIPGLHTDSAPPGNPMEYALAEFDANLNIRAIRSSSVIELTFTHPDAALAAEALQMLEVQYLDFRRQLFKDVQMPIVRVQVDQLSKQLEAAENRVLEFKRDHDITNFQSRREILLQQQGEAERVLRQAESGVAQTTARLAELDQQMRAPNRDKAVALAPMQSVVEGFRDREAQTRDRYLAVGRTVDEARTQVLQHQAEVARLQSQQMLALKQDRDRVSAELRASTALRAETKTQLDKVVAELRAISDLETQVAQLERARTLAEESYRSAAKIMTDRGMLENVDAGKQAAIRIIQPPETPIAPEPLRRQIAVAGALISLILGALVALLSHYFRDVILLPEALEAETELPVLASVPQIRGLARSAIAVHPS
jgi:uncharacterized protein involved in exopolysaccharide biosynthesis